MDAQATAAARLLEALEGTLTISPADAAALWEHHRCAPLNECARFLTSLSKGANLDATQLRRFDPLNARMDALVEEHRNAVGWSERSESDGCVISVQVVVSDPPRGAHDQAVELCRLILDLCPEADHAEVITLDADGQRLTAKSGDLSHEPAYKRIPRSNLPGPADTRVHSDFLDAARRMLAARYWTDRLRQQAQSARTLADLLSQVPLRLLHRNDNPRRRREWSEGIRAALRDANALPPPPLPDLDRNTSDPSGDALQGVATALDQLRQQVDAPDPGGLAGIAGQLRQTLPQLSTARDAGTPKLASVGDCLPQVLDEAIDMVADLLFALREEPGLANEITRDPGQPWEDVARTMIAHVRNSTLWQEAAALERVFLPVPAPAQIHRIPHRDYSTFRLVTDRWLVTIDIEQWKEVQRLVQLPEEVRFWLAFRVHAIPTLGDRALPLFGVRMGMNTLYPADEEDISVLCKAAGLRIFRSELVAKVQHVIDLLGSASRWGAVAHLRAPTFAPDSQIAAAQACLTEARSAADKLPPRSIGGICHDLATIVTDEIESGRQPGIAAQLAVYAREGRNTELITALNNLVIAAAIEDVSGSNINELM